MMKVLSLFDGISCGMVALERAEIPVERYAAYEIDKYAVKISEKNYPQIEHCGNVFDGEFTQYKGFDLLIGGSPCTYWSIAKNHRETTADGEGFRLFMEYVRALKESECKYFLYENNYSIHKNIKEAISTKLGVEPIMINSALVSAQQRKRCYWTNIPNIVQPEDKGILVKDILESGVAWQGKSFCMTANYHPSFKHTLQKHMNTMIAEPVILQRGHGFNKGGVKCGKCPTITANGTFVHNNFVAEPIRIGNIGSNAQGHRVYSVSGKSITISANGGGQGGTTGLYKIDLPDGDCIIRKLSPIECERLQTLPDNYTEGVSNTQRYKQLGNGWTVDVIAHILSNIK